MEARTAGATTFLLGACTAVLAAVTLGYFLYYGLGFSRLQILHAALVAAAIISGALVQRFSPLSAE
jgi:asparagine N-glycosylation enzyme membrane subunit Stt3